jgi:DNA-binding CsgD family transcriptional regulator
MGQTECGPDPYDITAPPRPAARGQLGRDEKAGPRFCDEPPMTEQEWELLVLLALGFTDSRAAAKMFISDRSVTTIARRLMDRFGVNNRFQLGLVAGALGLSPRGVTTNVTRQMPGVGMARFTTPRYPAMVHGTSRPR